MIMMLNRENSLEAQKHGYSVRSQKRYDDMQHDLYVSEKKAKKYEKRGFPTILKYLGVGIIATGIIKCRKDIVKGLKKLLHF